MSKEPPKKKRKFIPDDINNQKLERTKILNGSFASLFLFDWFLIELGRKLIAPANDSNLINILCLCREIYEKATIIFRQHFLNFDLQKQIFELTKNKDLNEIQKIFMRNGLALNPNNIPAWLENQKLCVHDETTKKYLPHPSTCRCAHKRNIPLVVMATRFVGMDSLVKAILFHPRFRWSPLGQQIKDADSREISNWAVVNGYWDVLERLIQVIFDRPNPQKKYSAESIRSHFDWPFIYVAAVIYSRFEILKKINELLLPDKRLHALGRRPAFVNICSLRGEEGPKYFEQIFNSPFYYRMNSDSFKSTLLASCLHGVEFVRICMKKFFNLISQDHSHSVRKSFASAHNLKAKTMKVLCSTSNNNDNEFLAIKFTFGIGSENNFRSLFMEREWTDQELLKLLIQYPFQKFKTSQVRCFELIWNNLSASFKFEENDVELILGYLKEMKSYELFRMVWNDKRVGMNRQLANQLVLKMALKMDLELLKIVIPNCDLSHLSTLHYSLNQDLTLHSENLEFRNLFFLHFCFENIRNYKGVIIDMAGFEMMLEILGIKWDESLFDLFLNFCNFETWTRLFSVSVIWLLRSDSIDPAWWTSERIQNLCQACRSFADTYDYSDDPTNCENVVAEVRKNFPKHFDSEVDFEVDSEVESEVDSEVD